MSNNNGFMKNDSEKLRYDLIPPEILKGLAEVFTFGAAKYADNNWKLCKNTDKFYSAAMRHVETWRAGESFDEESGFHHLKHFAWNACALLYLETKNAEGTE